MRIINQIKFTSNIRQIDLFLRKQYDETIALQYLDQLSLATQYRCFKQGSQTIKARIIAINTNDSEHHLSKYVPLLNKIKMYNSLPNEYLNSSIKVELLDQQVKLSVFLKWVYLQDDATFEQYLPLAVNQILFSDTISARAHKYIAKIKQRNLKLEILNYEPHVRDFIENYKNTKHKILLKQQLSTLFQLNYNNDQCLTFVKKYEDLNKYSNIVFFQKFPCKYLLPKILNQGLNTFKHKNEVVKLSIQLMTEEYQEEILNQMTQLYESEDIFFEELKLFLQFLIKYPHTEFQINVYRIFADKHYLFDIKEFEELIKLINQLPNVNIQDEDQLYKSSIYEELRAFYLKNMASLSQEVHLIFIEQLKISVGQQLRQL